MLSFIQIHKCLSIFSGFFSRFCLGCRGGQKPPLIRLEDSPWIADLLFQRQAAQLLLALLPWRPGHRAGQAYIDYGHFCTTLPPFLTAPLCAACGHRNNRWPDYVERKQLVNSSVHSRCLMLSSAGRHLPLCRLLFWWSASGTLLFHFSAFRPTTEELMAWYYHGGGHDYDRLSQIFNLSRSCAAVQTCSRAVGSTRNQFG